MTSATGRSEAGFTLVELVVAIAIIGIASAALMLTLPGPETRVRAEAERLAARAAAARDTAILTGQPVAFTASARDGLAVATDPAGPIQFDATGLATPAIITVSSGSAAASIRIDAAGGVHAGAR